MYDKKNQPVSKPYTVSGNQSPKGNCCIYHAMVYGHPNKAVADTYEKHEVASIQQQKVKANGTVVDQTGEPLIGVSVKVKDAPNGTITNLDGKFSIDVAKGATLEISYVGYKTVIVKAESTPMHIVLKEDSEMIDEVVVVGYGSQKKVNVTGCRRHGQFQST